MEYDYSYPPYIIANIVAVFIVVVASDWPTISRVLLGIIFIAASAVNLFFAIYNPNAYLEFSQTTPIGFYREIILGPFSQDTRLYIILIAVCQLLIGIFTTYQGILMRVAMLAGATFLFAIAPLGYGAAFPATMMLGVAFLILVLKRIDVNIYDTILRKSVPGKEQSTSA